MIPLPSNRRIMAPAMLFGLELVDGSGERRLMIGVAGASTCVVRSIAILDLATGALAAAGGVPPSIFLVFMVIGKPTSG